MGNILNVKPQYASVDWERREQYYTAELAKLPVPVDPDTKEVMRYSSEVDSLMAEALMDYAYIDRSYQHFVTMKKNAEKECFSIVKQNELAKPGAKVTEKDIEGLTIAYLKSNLIGGLPYSIYEVVMAAEKREIFMSAVIDILKSKRESIVTINTMVKIENKI